MKKEKTIVVACEVFSPNIGDGVIAESTKYLIEQNFSMYRVCYLDISGRTKPSDISTTANTKKSRLPNNTWSNLVRRMYLRHRYYESWSNIIKGADRVIIGGGQLLMDNSLSFPLKIELITSIAEKYNVPVHIFAVGVGAGWSLAAKFLFNRVIKNVKSVSVRDTLSSQHLQRHFPNLSIGLTIDPAIFAKQVYKTEPVRSKIVGLGIMSLEQINRFANTIKLQEEDLVQLWINLAIKLQSKNISFELFTNGSPKDHQFAEHIAVLISQNTSVDCTIALRPLEPEQLIKTIQKYQALVASRLHAHIIATSFGIPSVALVWDPKVRAFFKDTGRSELALDIFTADANQSMLCLERACAKGIDPALMQEKCNLMQDALGQILN